MKISKSWENRERNREEEGKEENVREKPQGMKAERRRNTILNLQCLTFIPHGMGKLEKFNIKPSLYSTTQALSHIESSLIHVNVNTYTHT